MKELPSVDSAFGQDPTRTSNLPNVDDVLGPKKDSIATATDPTSSPAIDGFLQNHPIGRIMGAFGSAVSGALTEDGTLGIQMGGGVEKSLINAGIFNDYMKGENNINKAVNEAFIRPAAAALDAGYRGVNAAMGGVGSAVQQASVEADAQLPKPIQGLLPQLTEYALTTPALMEAHSLPHEVAQARANAVIGETEETYFGLQEPTPEQARGRDAAKASIEQPPEVPAPQDIHQAVRQANPELFDQYDTLTNVRKGYSDYLGKAFDEQTKEISTPFDEQISTLQSKIEDANKRKTKIYQAQIDDLTDQKQKALDVRADTPEMQIVRSASRQADYQMRDMAPDVSAAYRDAQAKMPSEETIEPAQEAKAPEEEPQENTQESTPPPLPSAITMDVSRQLQRAGRPKEEADAASQLIASHYQSISDLGWTKGTPEEIYAKDFPRVKQGKQTSATQGKLHIPFEKNLKSTMTLFGKADASTFIHETGHHFLDEMMKYAKAEDAPESLLTDVKTIKDWLKSEGDITRAQHEKFARGFERYLMEGTAPTRALAGVFEKFKQWLTSIYQTVAKLKSPITDDIRDVFDRLLTANPERTVIAPEGEAEPAELENPAGGNTPNEVPMSQDQPQAQPVLEQPGAIPMSSAEGREIGEKGVSMPESPNSIIPRSETKLIDKAGNIRIENLNTPEDVSEVIRQTARDNDDFMQGRRGVISDGQVLDLADALGMDASKLEKRKLGQAFNAEQVVAARKLLIQSASEVRDAMSKAADGEDTDVLAYAETKARHIMIQEQVSGITAEAGRALRAFRELEGSDVAKATGDFLKQATGQDLFQLKEEAKLGASLDTPQKVSKFVNDSKEPTARDKILEYYINSLISGPITHLRYSIGNAINAIATPLIEIPTASLIGKIRGAEDGVQLGEAKVQLQALMKGSQEGVRAATSAWRSGVSPALPGEDISPQFTQKTNAIKGPLGKVINIPSRSVAAIHSFFKSIRYEQNIQGLAYRMAHNEGLEGNALSAKMAELTTSPSKEMMDTATANSLKELYMSPTEYNSTAGKLTSAINSNLAAKIIMPFMKIGSQITRNAFIERTPLGLLDSKIRDTLAEGGAVRDFQLAKMATGTALMGAMSLAVLEGKATGDGPADPNKKAIWLLNHKPNTLQIGNITIPYQGLGHLGMLMRFSANMTETAQGWDHEDGLKLAKGFMEGITKSVLDENFMRGLKDMLDAVYHPEEYGEKYVRGFALNWLPFSVGMGQMARTVDPSQREYYDIFEQAKAKTLYSDELQPRRDRFGEVIPNGGDLDIYKNDPVVNRMESLNMGIGRLDKKIRGVQLSEQQYDDYSKLAGRMAKMRLNNYVSIPGTAQLPAEIQMKAIQATIDDSREKARRILMMNNPDIIRKALQAKMGVKTPQIPASSKYTLVGRNY